MEDFVKELLSSVNIILGALCALLGALVQSRFSEKNTKKRILSEKLERAYLLCQDIYDGHKREILNAVKYLPSDAAIFLEKRNHPGKETSELKMLIRSYAPDLSAELQKLDQGHEPLKMAFRKLENEVLSQSKIAESDISKRRKTWDEYLRKLGQGTNAIKAGIEKTLNELTK